MGECRILIAKSTIPFPVGFPTQQGFLLAQICASSAQQKLIAYNSASSASSAIQFLRLNLRNKLNKLSFKSEKNIFLICKKPVYRFNKDLF